MARVLFFALIFLAASLPVMAQDAVPSVPPPNNVVSEECPHQDWVGKKTGEIDYTQYQGPLRIFRPGYPIPMEEAMPNRLNLHLDANDETVIAVTCG